MVLQLTLENALAPVTEMMLGAESVQPVYGEEEEVGVDNNQQEHSGCSTAGDNEKHR